MAGVPFDVQRNMTKEEYDALTPEEKVERRRLKNREAQQNLRMKKAQEIAVLRDTLAMAEGTTRVIEGEYRRLMLEGASVDVDRNTIVVGAPRGTALFQSQCTQF